MKKYFSTGSGPVGIVILITLLLMIIGGINVWSASFVSAGTDFGNAQYFMWRYVALGIVSFLGMLFLAFKSDYHWLLRHSKEVFLGMLALLAMVYIGGTVVKGARRWLSIGGFSVQPSEFAKLAVIIIGASLLGKLMKKGELPTLRTAEGRQGLVEVVCLCALVIAQPDMGTAAVIFAIMAFLYVLAGMPRDEIFGCLAIAVMGVVALVAVAPYRLDRFRYWLNPWLDPEGKGYQMVQSMITIGSGGLFGTKVGMGSGKFFYLPEAHTDFAFAIWCQEWGFIMALVLIGIFVGLGYMLHSMAAEINEEEGYLIISGVNFYVVGQAIANMAMVCGVFPVIGVPLSFISYGGSALLTNLLALGLAINVYNREKKRQGQKAERTFGSRGLPSAQRSSLTSASRRGLPPSKRHSNTPVPIKPRGWRR